MQTETYLTHAHHIRIHPHIRHTPSQIRISPHQIRICPHHVRISPHHVGSHVPFRTVVPDLRVGQEGVSASVRLHRVVVDGVPVDIDVVVVEECCGCRVLVVEVMPGKNVMCKVF